MRVSNLMRVYARVFYVAVVGAVRTHATAAEQSTVSTTQPSVVATLLSASTPPLPDVSRYVCLYV